MQSRSQTVEPYRPMTYNVCTAREEPTMSTTKKTARTAETQERVTQEARTERMNLRARPDQVSLIEQAAKEIDQNISQFVLMSATTAAEIILANRRRFVLDEPDWTEFVAILDRPVRHKPKLARLLREPSIFANEERRDDTSESPNPAVQ